MKQWGLQSCELHLYTTVCLQYKKKEFKECKTFFSLDRDMCQNMIVVLPPMSFSVATTSLMGILCLGSKAVIPIINCLMAEKFDPSGMSLVMSGRSSF